VPSAVLAQALPQHSLSSLQPSPAERQPGAGGTQRLAAQAPPQQERPSTQAPVVGAHSPGAQRPEAASQNSEQHAPARAQG
jgi:hypothetical protein